MKFLFAVVCSALLGLSSVAARAASIAGQVTRSSDGAPIAAAKVSAWAQVCVTFCTPMQIGTATTDSAGHYLIGDLADRDYAVYTETDTYADTDQAGSTCLVPSSCFAHSGRIMVTGNVAGVDFVLAPGATLSGHVVDTVTGLPAAGRDVLLTDGVGLVDAVSGADGAYAFAGLPGAHYSVSIEDYGFDADTRLTQYYPDQDCDNLLALCPTTLPLDLPAAGTRSDVDFHLHRGAYVHASIVDVLTQQPIPFSTLRVVPAGDPARTRDANCSADGSCVSGPFVAGEVKLAFYANGHTAQMHALHDCDGADCDFSQADTLTLQAAVDPAPIAVQLTPLYTVSGVVRNAVTHEPVAGLRVAAGEATVNSFPFVLNWGFSASVQTLTDADGSYILTGFPQGAQWIVRTMDDSGSWTDGAWQNVLCGHGNRLCNDPASTPAYARTNFVAQPHMTGVDLAILPAGHIAGHASWRAEGNPVSVFLIEPSTLQLMKRFAIAQDGSYSVGNLPSGYYYVMIAAVQPVGTARGNLYPDGRCEFFAYSQTSPPCDYASAFPVYVYAGATTSDIDLVLPPPDPVFRDGFDG